MAPKPQPSPNRSRSRSCSRGRGRGCGAGRRREAEEEHSDCVVQVVSAFSDEILCTLQLPRSGTVLDVKRRVQATQGINVFRQRFVISPDGPQAEDHEVLAALPGLRLRLVKLEYSDDDKDVLNEFLNATVEGAAPEVERLLRLPLRPDCSDGYGTPLIFASVGGYLDIVRLLCGAGANKDKAAENGTGTTPLMVASRAGHLEVARLLCEAGADKDKAAENGATPLMVASRWRQLEVARLLCEAGANKDKATVDGDTALIVASREGHLEVARLLCEAGTNKDKATVDGDTALMVASREGHWKVYDALELHRARGTTQRCLPG